MSTFNLVAKILAVLAVIAGLVLVFLMYGDKIIAFCKKLTNRWSFRSCMEDGEEFAEESDFDLEDITATEQDFAE